MARKKTHIRGQMEFDFNESDEDEALDAILERIHGEAEYKPVIQQLKTTTTTLELPPSVSLPVPERAEPEKLPLVTPPARRQASLHEHKMFCNNQQSEVDPVFPEVEPELTIDEQLRRLQIPGPALYDQLGLFKSEYAYDRYFQASKQGRPVFHSYGQVMHIASRQRRRNRQQFVADLRERIIELYLNNNNE